MTGSADPSQVLAQQFNLADDISYLNHAAVAPWPKCTVDAIAEFAKENRRYGASHYPKWVQTEQNLRAQLQKLINAKSHADIALVKNTSEALSMVAYGVSWTHRDNIVISRQEFPSNRIVWESIRDKFNVELRYADLNSEFNPEQAVLACCDQNTKLLSISSVQYANGLRLDLDKLGEYCNINGILFCVDAIQSLGLVPFDVQQCQAHFVMADAHKWLLGPEGIALFYCREDVREQLQLYEYGWHMVENLNDYDSQQWQVAASSRRFECGSPNMLGIHGFNASLSLILELGVEQIHQLTDEKLQYLLSRLQSRDDIEIISAYDQHQRAGIVTFRIQSWAASDHEELYRQLMAKKIICAPRGGGIRFSPHAHNSPESLERAVDTLFKLI